MTKPFWRRIFWLLAVLPWSQTALAAMPPYVEAPRALARIESAQKFRLEAPEVVRIKVTDARMLEESGNGCPTIQQWRVSAQVLAVTRGALKAGQPISITYEANEYLCTGPVHESMPTLKPGQDTAAFLRCEGSACRLAAWVMSFMSDAEFEIELERRRRAVQEFRPPSPPEVPFGAPFPKPDRVLLDRNTVYFAAGKTTLLNAAQTETLILHAKFLIANPRAFVLLNGYADRKGTRKYAEALGLQRAEAIGELLEKAGVKHRQLGTRSLGNSDPWAENSKPPAGAGNGRVEFFYANDE